MLRPGMRDRAGEQECPYGSWRISRGAAGHAMREPISAPTGGEKIERWGLGCAGGNTAVALQRHPPLRPFDHIILKTAFLGKNRTCSFAWDSLEAFLSRPSPPIARKYPLDGGDGIYRGGMLHQGHLRL